MEGQGLVLAGRVGSAIDTDTAGCALQRGSSPPVAALTAFSLANNGCLDVVPQPCKQLTASTSIEAMRPREVVLEVSTPKEEDHLRKIRER